jgi:tetratricopeptide (TPR) repeat protein
MKKIYSSKIILSLLMLTFTLINFEWPVWASPPVQGGPATTLFNQASSSFAAGQCQDAITAANKLLATYPDSDWADDAQNMIALIHLFQGENQEAQRAFQTLVEKYPNSEYASHAQFLLSLGNLSQMPGIGTILASATGISCQEPSSGVAPTSTPVISATQEVSLEGDGDTLRQAGEAFYRQARYSEALDSLQAALAYDQNPSTRDPAGEGLSLITIGQVYHGQGRFDEALTTFQQALEIFKALADPSGQMAALNSMGRVYADRSSRDEARNSFQEVLNILERSQLEDPVQEGLAQHGLGGLDAEEGNYDEASQRLQQALVAIRAAALA